jgi:hypothetical protein
MILQQVAGSQMISLLDGFFSYNQIKVKGVDKYKTILITHLGTLTYKCIPSGLSDASVTFKIPMQVTFDYLIDKIIHIYLDDLIVYVKRLSIVSKFQELWLGPFKIDVV